MHTRLMRSISALVVATVLAGAGLFAQALPNLNSARVSYNTRKTTVKPEGELKAQIEQIDKEMEAAVRLGRLGDYRRLIAKGMALLAGRTWTAADEFQASLAIRTDRMAVDSSAPYRVRLEQIFAPSIELSRPLTARAALRPRGAPRPGGAEAPPRQPVSQPGSRSGGALAPPPAAPAQPAARAATSSGAASAAPPATSSGAASAAPPGTSSGAASAAPPEVAPPPIALGTFEGVARDLRESPFPLPLNLAAVPDGSYTLAVEVLDQDRSLGTATLNITVLKGLDTRLRALEAAAAKAPLDIQADLRYPADSIRKINEGLVELGQFNAGNELLVAEAVAAGAKTGKNPFVGRTGDFERHYVLQAAGEIMPYRVFVPTVYSASKPSPLVIALHGLGGNEDSMFDQYTRTIPSLAEKHGFLIASPMGYRSDGFYGSGIVAGADPAVRRRSDLSEQDVMEVLRRMREQYKIDDSRIYLMGHSMGAIGTWALGAKYPDIWAALGPVSGTGSAATVAKMRHIPWFVVHGDADPTVNVNGSRSMVAEMKKLGGEVVYVEVPGGNHTNIAVPNFPAMFEFFDAHRKTTTTSQE